MSQAYVNVPVESRPVQGFPMYRVGIDGSVWSCWRGRGFSKWTQLKPTMSGLGYQKVGLYDGTGYYVFRLIHDLVLEAFVGPRPIGMEACHFPDRTRSNNHLNNLRWDTRSNNQHDKKWHDTDNRGHKNSCAKLTPEQVMEIRQRDEPSRIIGQEFGVSETAVNLIRRFATYRNVGDDLPPAPVKQCRQKQTNYRGERHFRATLTNQDVVAIRSLREHLTLRELSEQFGVTKATISRICLRRVWTHI